jgi:hypothetical protein
MDTSDQRLRKLLHRLQLFVDYLSGSCFELTVHQHIDQFYYMTKIRELNILRQRMDEALVDREKVCEYIESKCQEVYGRWRNEARWLNRHLISRGYAILEKKL